MAVALLAPVWLATVDRLIARFDTDLCPRFSELLHSAGLLPEHTSHPTTPSGQDLPLATDGMLHEAHATMRYSKVTDTCFLPTSPTHPRPCPAREAGKDGCDCTGSACAKEHYASRKNAVEGRNSQITRLGPKRIWSYDLAGATADITFQDSLRPTSP